MFLRSLHLANYGIFEDATFDLTTDVDHPVILISGNNGAGKTSILEALRVALHGRRAFDVPMGEAEYLRTITNRFHLGDMTRECSISLDFDFVDFHKKKTVKIERSFAVRRQHIAESLLVTVDEKAISTEDAEDLLNAVVPPEIARYFFFDGERIRELAEWELEDESALFTAVGDLLGLGVLDQLRTDLLRISSTEKKATRGVRDSSTLLDDAKRAALAAHAALSAATSKNRKIRGALDRARAAVRRVGALQNDELLAIENELGELTAERRSLHEETQRVSADILPLLLAKTLRSRFSSEIGARKRIEDREIVAAFFLKSEQKITDILKSHGLKTATAKNATAAMSKVAMGSPIAVNASLPNLSRSDAVWMQRVIEHELPEMANRSRDMLERLRYLDEQIVTLESRKRTAPINDSAGEAALEELERRQRDFMEHETLIRNLEAENIRAQGVLDVARDVAQAQRIELFREGRLRLREQMMNQVLDSLPTLAQRLESSKENRFGRYLGDALRELWHKTDRLVGVDVSFSERRIALLDAHGEIRKRDLSAGEKQLFAIAFIYALAKLSGRLMPFVIDTPLGRLDKQHRSRFVAEFLPNASHQVILLSTDTEIVGSLYEELRPLMIRHHELSEFNGGATAPVEVSA